MSVDEIPIVYYQQSYDFNVFVDVSYSNQFDQINSSNLELHLNNPFVDTAFTIDSEESYSPDGDWFQFDDQFCGIYQPYVIWLNSPSGCSDTLELITYSNQELDFGNDINSNNICDGLEISGCTDSTALNYDFQATLDDGSCVEIIQGCTDSTANNYLSDANVDDGSCNYNIFGCIDINACNYNEEANTDDGSCTYLEVEYTINNNSCPNDEVGYIFVSPLSGTAPYSYSWSNGGNNSFLMNLSSGEYILNLTDDSGCQLTDTIVLEQPVSELQDITPEICYLTVDDATGKNKIV